MSLYHIRKPYTIGLKARKAKRGGLGGFHPTKRRKPHEPSLQENVALKDSLKYMRSGIL